MPNFQDKANFIWQVADDILCGPFKENEYGEVTLPFVVLRRLDCVLEKTKDTVIATYDKFKNAPIDPKPVPMKSSGQNFYNTSCYDLSRLAQDAKNIEINFNNYLSGYSEKYRTALISAVVTGKIDVREEN